MRAQQRVVVVAGACGGVGTSTLAALVAAEAARAGAGTALVDVAAHGAGIEVLLGVEGRPGARWRDLDGLRGSIAPADLDGVLPVWRGVEVLGGDRRGGGPPGDALEAVWPALRERCTTVVVDAPVTALDGDVGEVVLAGAPSVLVVTGQDVRGVAAALAALAVLPPAAWAAGAGDPDDSRSAALVLRGRRAPRVAPAEAAGVLGLPLAGVLPTDRGVAEACDRGFGPVVGRRSALARAVARVTRAAGVHPGGTASAGVGARGEAAWGWDGARV
ncbi:P-loop NTPase [Actinotalea solisilvae]|uniref:P-loop NTPase n=1 Tax=Actinotalea solisilvae TaxID=2072922 RepID=UPI0018F23E70|nr:P-loop NTPase [Actinotalea solisilvae]